MSTGTDNAVRRAQRTARRVANRRVRRSAPAAEAKKVLAGRNGWLFLCNDANDVLGQYTGRLRLSNERLDGWSALIEARLELAGDLDVTWLTSVVPGKEVVYPEFLPDGLVRAAHRPVDDILHRAGALGASFSYPLARLQAAKRNDNDLPVYGSTSAHWTDYAAFVVYEETCHALRDRGIDLPTLSCESIVWESILTSGDLGGKVDPPRFGRSVRAHLRRHRSQLVFDNRVRSHGGTMIFERNDALGPSAVVFGQSSALSLLIFLKESFRRLLFVHTCTMPREILQRERPDIVLAYPAERFMIRVPDDSSAMLQLAEAIRIKRDRGALRPRWDARWSPGVDRKLGDEIVSSLDRRRPPPKAPGSPR